jgi:hypothetical protein
MLVEKNPALSIVDAGTGFCASRFLAAENIGTMWNTFLEALSLMFVGWLSSVGADRAGISVLVCAVEARMSPRQDSFKAYRSRIAQQPKSSTTASFHKILW